MLHSTADLLHFFFLIFSWFCSVSYTGLYCSCVASVDIARCKSDAVWLCAYLWLREETPRVFFVPLCQECECVACSGCSARECIR
uniref:Putative secreted protein n=1 Tax=Amblyomma triste TaxID=251400 RepID=A0A023G1G6_AMBTT